MRFRIVVGQCFLLLVVAVQGFCLEVPHLNGRVNDNAGLLSEKTKTRLDALLARHEEKTTDQIAILTIPSLEGEVLEDYSHRVAQTWGLGVAKKDNGILVLVVKNDRRVRIEVGYGLEPVIPDGKAGRIIREKMVPFFKRGDFDGGVAAGVDEITRCLLSGPPETVPTAQEGLRVLFLLMIVVCFYAGFLVFSIRDVLRKKQDIVSGTIDIISAVFLGLMFLIPAVLLTVFTVGNGVFGYLLGPVLLVGYLVLCLWVQRKIPNLSKGSSGRKGYGSRKASSSRSHSSGRRSSGGGGSFGGGGASGRW